MAHDAYMMGQKGEQLPPASLLPISPTQDG